METENRPTQPARQHQPIGRRPTIDGFAPRRPATATPHPANHPQRSLDIRPRPTRPTPEAAPLPHRTTPTTSAPHTHTPGATLLQPRPVLTQTRQADFIPNREAPTPPPALEAPAIDIPTDTPSTRPPKEPSPSGHAGLVGLVAFLVLAALLLAPILPGSVLQNLPLTSSTFSTGNQSLDCLGTQGRINTSTKYTSKLGAPLAYSSATDTMQSATCDGQPQQVLSGHTSEFSPLALAIDSVIALALAIAIGHVWRIFFRRRHAHHGTLKAHH